MTYTYEPEKIRARGKDQMRFELGDTQVDGGAETCALADEEYGAFLAEVRHGIAKSMRNGLGRAAPIAAMSEANASRCAENAELAFSGGFAAIGETDFELFRYKRAWLGAKIQILEAILLKLSYQVDTKIDVLTYGLGKRAEHWKNLYEMLRKEMIANAGLPSISDEAAAKPPYFHTDMNLNPRID